MDAENVCGDKARLALEWGDAARKYSEAVRNLITSAFPARQEYQRLKRIADEHRAMVEKAELALDTHVSEHGC